MKGKHQVCMEARALLADQSVRMKSPKRGLCPSSAFPEHKHNTQTVASKPFLCTATYPPERRIFAHTIEKHVRWAQKTIDYLFIKAP